MTTSEMTYTTENGKVYEIDLRTDSFSAEVKNLDTGRVYPCDCSEDTDEDATEEENVEWALSDAREWCEWHSKQDGTRERMFEDGYYRCF